MINQDSLRIILLEQKVQMLEKEINMHKPNWDDFFDNVTKLLYSETPKPKGLEFQINSLIQERNSQQQSLQQLLRDLSEIKQQKQKPIEQVNSIQLPPSYTLIDVLGLMKNTLYKLLNQNPTNDSLFEIYHLTNISIQLAQQKHTSRDNSLEDQNYQDQIRTLKKQIETQAMEIKMYEQQKYLNEIRNEEQSAKIQLNQHLLKFK